MRNTAKRESGYVLVVLAGVLVILLGFAALAVDLGIMYGAHTAAQRAADAAALAGAYTYLLSPTATAIQMGQIAQDRAMGTAQSNTILGKNLVTSEVVVTPDVPNRRVAVTVTHSIPTFFAGVLGQKSATISATGVAEASTTPTGSKCVKPWFIPNTIFSTQDPCDPNHPPATATRGACFDGEYLVVPGSSPPIATAWALNQIRLQTPTNYLTVKPGNPTNAISPGNFYAVQLSNDPNQSGGNVYRDNIATCGDQSTIRCGELYNVKTGNMIGPTNQGIGTFVCGDANGTCRPGDGDTFGGFYSDGSPWFRRHGDTTNEWTDSNQIAIAPIWDTCLVACSSCPGGDCGELPGNGVGVQIRVVGFALIFIDGVVGNDVKIHLLNVIGCDLSQTTSGPPGPFSLPIRLVRTN